MISRALLAIALLVPTACSSALSETECREAGHKELAYISATMGGDNEGLDKYVTPIIEQGVQRCIAGDGYTRKDYKCLMAAKTPQETRTCLQSANTTATYH